MPLLTLVIVYLAGLFTETITITAVCLGVFVIFYFRKKTKSYHITYLLTAILIAIMILAIKSNLPTIKRILLTTISMAFLIYYATINIYLKPKLMNIAYGYNHFDTGLGNLE